LLSSDIPVKESWNAANDREGGCAALTNQAAFQYLVSIAAVGYQAEGAVARRAS
jgi:hypothetical protein